MCPKEDVFAMIQYFAVFIHACMYDHPIQQSMDQQGKAANPACDQPNRGNEYSPVPVCG